MIQARPVATVLQKASNNGRVLWAELSSKQVGAIVHVEPLGVEWRTPTNLDLQTIYFTSLSARPIKVGRRTVAQGPNPTTCCRTPLNIVEINYQSFWRP
jgi:hypothetical protein